MKSGDDMNKEINGKNEEKCCCHREKIREADEYKSLINRLNRIEGQIRGIRKMVEENAYCADILTQASAASAAMDSFCRVLLEDHIKTCVSSDIRDGKYETVDELLEILRKLMR